jgi:hypothetical protein
MTWHRAVWGLLLPPMSDAQLPRLLISLHSLKWH